MRKTVAASSGESPERKRAYIGSKNSNSVLTEKQVEKIHKLRLLGKTFKEIGELLNVKPKTIHAAYNYGWKHVNATSKAR